MTLRTDNFNVREWDCAEKLLRVPPWILVLPACLLVCVLQISCPDVTERLKLKPPHRLVVKSPLHAVKLKKSVHQLESRVLLYFVFFKNTPLSSVHRSARALFAQHAKFYIEKLMPQIGWWFLFYSWMEICWLAVWFISSQRFSSSSCP